MGIIALATGLGLVLAYSVNKTVSGLKDLKPNLIGGRIIGQAGFFQNLTSLKIALDLAIENPNKKIINFQSFIGDVFYNDKPVSKINIVRKIPLRGNDTTLLKDIPVTINNLTAVAEIIKLIGGKKAATEIKIKGFVKADGFKLPVDEILNLSKQ